MPWILAFSGWDLVGTPAGLAVCLLGLPHRMVAAFQEEEYQEKPVEAFIGLALEVTKWSLSL